MPRNAPKKRAKSKWREFRITLEGSLRSDGSLFVTSPNLKPFCGILSSGDWEDIVPLVQKYLEANGAKVKEMRLIHDAAELFSDNEKAEVVPPAYLIAEVTKPHASAH